MTEKEIYQIYRSGVKVGFRKSAIWKDGKQIIEGRVGDLKYNLARVDAGDYDGEVELERWVMKEEDREHDWMGEDQ